MINIIGPINQLGYGVACLNIVKNLPDVALWPIGQIQVTNEYDAHIVRNALSNAIMPNFNAPCIKIWHQHDMSQFVGNGIKIGFPFFELNKFSNIEKHHLKYLDKIFVSSQWAKNIVIDQVSKNNEDVIIIPLGVDIDIFKPSEGSDNENTVFFNCGKWEIRKGHDILINAFNHAFEQDDKVELWMMCENPFLNESQTNEWHHKYKSSKLGNKIKFISRTQTQDEVYNIMAQTDCGVFPSRAEGWNLELLEMMACGKHVITTNYSAHTEFCSKDNANLIDITKEEMAYDGIWFNGKVGQWANLDEPQIEQLVFFMRKIHDQKSSNNLSINNAGIQTANKYTWQNSAKEIINNV